MKSQSWDLMMVVFTVTQGIEVENARIYDVAPTILHLQGISVPEDMDGHVLAEIFGR